MDAGMLTARRRNLALAIFHANKTAKQSDQPYTNREYTTLHHILQGQIPYFEHNKFVSTLNCYDVCTPEPDEDDKEPNCLLGPVVIMAVEDILKFTQSVTSGKLGPTKCSFVLYALWFGIATSFNWTQRGVISGHHDNWNWNTPHPISSATKQFLFLNTALLNIIPILFGQVPGVTGAMGQTMAFTTGPAYIEFATSMLNITEAQYNAQVADVSGQAHFAEWLSLYSNWFVTRNTSAIQVAGLPAVYPNSGVLIHAATGSDDIAGFPDPHGWTRIQPFPPATLQSYYTPRWQDISSASGFTPTEYNYIKSNANTFFPPNQASRDAEIDSIINITANLTDRQKATAEFWANIMRTVSPPGSMMWFWKQYVEAYNVVLQKGNAPFIYSGFHLALGLFEAGRAVWDLKYAHQQSRPIQDVRLRYRGQSVSSWNGTISGENWLPYQLSSFVTPPFPDFPSGHSAFSQTFANVMTTWFGPELPDEKPIQTLDDLYLLSPALTATQVQPIGSISFPAGGSQVETGVPATPVLFQFSSFQGMANEAGLSRQYGGIHPMAAHRGSQTLINTMYPIMNANWGLPV